MGFPSLTKIQIGSVCNREKNQNIGLPVTDILSHFAEYTGDIRAKVELNSKQI